MSLGTVTSDSQSSLVIREPGCADLIPALVTESRRITHVHVIGAVAKLWSLGYFRALRSR